LGEKGEVYVQKWHLRYKTSGVSETKQSTLEPKLLQSVYRNSCKVYRLVANVVTWHEIWPTFSWSNIFHNGYLADFLS